MVTSETAAGVSADLVGVCLCVIRVAMHCGLLSMH